MISEKKESLEDDHPLKKLKEENKYEESVIPSFTIVYATQSNTAKRFSERLAKDAQYLNIQTQVKNISELSVEEDFNKNLFLVFFISTYGEGGPSDDAMEFNRAMEKKTLFENFTNEKLNYAIFGLGSTKYEYYNQMAKKIDKFFAKKSLARVCDVGLGDDSKDINKDFAEWRKQFWLMKTFLGKKMKL
jgi:NADPH-ferrihemoprotein reductase